MSMMPGSRTARQRFGDGKPVAGDIAAFDGRRWKRVPPPSSGFSLLCGIVGGLPIWVASREVLTANRTYYVRTDGSDSNSGLANTSGGAFLTIQRAYDVISSTLDLGGKTVTMQVGAGTYAGALVLSQPWTGGGAVYLEGDTTTPANVVLSAATAVQVRCVLPGTFRVRGFRMTSSSLCLYHNGVGRFEHALNTYAGTGFAHLAADVTGASLIASGNYTVAASATYHLFCAKLAFAQASSGTITVSGTPAFSAFVYANALGSIEYAGVTFSGSATGSRYTVAANGVINSGGGGASFFPGNSAGSAATGGVYQ